MTALTFHQMTLWLKTLNSNNRVSKWDDLLQECFFLLLVFVNVILGFSEIKWTICLCWYLSRGKIFQSLMIWLSMDKALKTWWNCLFCCKIQLSFVVIKVLLQSMSMNDRLVGKVVSNVQSYCFFYCFFILFFWGGHLIIILLPKYFRSQTYSGILNLPVPPSTILFIFS